MIFILLSQYGKWKNYIKLKERYYDNTYIYFNTEEILRFVQTILEKYEYEMLYEPNQTLSQNFPNEPEELSHSEQCTWIIEYKKTGEKWEIKLKAQVESEKIVVASHYLNDGVLEKQVLEKGEIMLITTRSIAIYAINIVKNSEKNFRIYYFNPWNEESTSKQYMINLLTSFKNIINLNIYNLGFKILPLPTLEDYTKYKELTLLKLYGTDIFHKLLRKKSNEEAIDEFLAYCYENSLSMFKD
ncbi:hypothetical protein C2G38_1322483 [Gigaspora rosea]|uniref:Uncharacterized protein n=1 Tax=Gigaspora rosea TaxID=44941 RepID=A0A397VHG0_9GLOM|nr:hypothetical protein C2G38_1322483 [Gigaspora rosea]